MRQLKSHKAGGKNGILPDMIKSCGPHIILFCTVWREEQVPSEWRDAVLVPIPKKGDLTLCDNWRGISLLDVVGKLFAKIVQSRLQMVVEDLVPDSQCGFRKGKGCIDMIFCARQLVEKAREHNTSVYMLFVDLWKAYDSIPRQALWLVLQKYGIPPVTDGSTRRPSRATVNELLFADDAAIVSSTRENMERATQVLSEVTSEWGLTVSVLKTTLLVAGTTGESGSKICNQCILEVKLLTFKYLGAIIEENSDVKRDVEDRIARASRAFGALKRLVFRDNDISLRTETCLSCSGYGGPPIWGRHMGHQESRLQKA